MDWTLANIDLLVGILVGLVTGTATIIKFIVSPIRRHWDGVKAAHREEIADKDDRHKAEIESITADYQREISYMERVQRDLKDDLTDTKNRLERCEARWNNPQGFQV